MPRKPKQTKKEKMEKYFARFKTHAGPKGNASSWRKAVSKMILDKTDELAEYLAVLGMDKPPSSLSAINSARRAAMKKAHPDIAGHGSTALAAKINAAHEYLKGWLNAQA